MPLYELGRESDESAARWKELPRVEGLSEIVTPGIPLLTAGGRPVLELVPRKGGAVIVTGISDFSAAAAPSAASVNRFMSESLLLGLTPLAEPGAAGGMFPPQPVLGRDVFLIGNASAGNGLDQPQALPRSTASNGFASPIRRRSVSRPAAPQSSAPSASCSADTISNSPLTRRRCNTSPWKPAASIATCNR